MKLISYNCFNFKANHLMVKCIMNEYDVCFFSEHWLGDSEGYLFNDICRNQSTIFSADFENSTRDRKVGRGRPFGGRCWVVRDSLNIKSYDKMSKSLSRLIVVDSFGVETIIYGVWQSFDDGSVERLSLFHSTLSMLEAEIKYFSDSNVVFMVDFNADLARNRRFDGLL